MPHGPPRIRLADGNMNIIGQRLKSRRKVSGITQEQLCGRVASVSEGSWNPSRYDVRRIEAGTRTVSDVELIALAAGVECSVSLLLYGTEEEPSISELARRTFQGARATDEA